MVGKRYEYEAMAECEKELWWYKCLHELTLKKIHQVADKNASILDAGCGTGGMLVQLKNHGFTNLSGFDLSTDAVDYTRKNGFASVLLLNILDCDNAFPPNSFDVIISNDILCLLNAGDDKVAFEKLIFLLKPGGSLLMNLPASDFFKGTHDDAVGIQTRYTKTKLKRLTSDSAAEIKEVYHWPFLLSPLIFSIRFFQRGKMFFSKRKQYKSDVSLPPPLLNTLFYKLTRFENKALRSKAWGSSIFVTVVKK